MVRSSSAGKAAILRVAAAEAAAEAAEAAAVAVAATGPSPSSGIVTAGAAIALEDGGVVGDGEWQLSASASEEALEALEERDDRLSTAGRSTRGVSDAVREEVQRSLDVAGAIDMGEEEAKEEEEYYAVESLEKEERRRLRARAFAIVVYASGDR